MCRCGAWFFCLPAAVAAAPASALTVSDHLLARPAGQRHFIAVEAEGKPKAKRPS